MLLNHDTSAVYEMPETEEGVWDVINHLTPGGLIASVSVVIERVSGYAGKKRGGQPGSTMFNFGMGYGGLRMALIGSGLKFKAVTPQKWQRSLGLRTKTADETKTQWKNYLKSVALRLFPQEHVTLAASDALLIAEYCRRLSEGTMHRPLFHKE